MSDSCFSRCKIPGLNNDSWDNTEDDLVKKYIPPSSDYPYDRCHLYDHSNDNSTTNSTTNSSEVKCNHWVYDTAVFKSTFVKQVSKPLPMRGSRELSKWVLISLAIRVFHREPYKTPSRSFLGPNCFSRWSVFYILSTTGLINSIIHKYSC